MNINHICLLTKSILNNADIQSKRIYQITNQKRRQVIKFNVYFSTKENQQYRPLPQEAVS